MKKTFVLFAVTLTAAAQLLKSEAAATTRLEQHPVFTAQFILNQLGYDAGHVDGAYGPRTAAAIAEFYEQTDYKDDDPDHFNVTDLTALIEVSDGESIRTTPFSGAEHENSNAEYLYPPISPAITNERYWFGHFWANYDFDNNGLLDFIYTGTMNPENVEVTGEDTAGLCGGRDCEGEMP